MLNIPDIKHTVQLGQVQPTTANVTLLATKPAKEKWLITSINVCNSDSSTRGYSVLVDQDGIVQTSNVAIVSNTALSANTAVQHEWVHGLAMNKGTTAGHIYVQATAANVMTFTVCGIIA